MTVDFDFDIKQPVKIKSIGMIGTVDSMTIDINGKQYRVVYWNDGGRFSTWMYEWEIEAINK